MLTRKANFLKTNIAVLLTLLNLSTSPALLAQSVMFPGPGLTSAPLPDIVSHVGAVGANAATTASIDTTGSNLIVLNATGQTVPVVITDSKSNTWTPLAQNFAGSSLTSQLFYCESCIVGSGHTFTTTASGGFNTINVIAFKNAASPVFEQQGGDTGFASGATTQSLTPYAANAILVTGICTSGVTINSINQSFTITDSENFNSGVNWGGGIAYQIQTSATTRNPAWTTSSAGGTTSYAVFRGTIPTGTYFVRGTFFRGPNGGTTAAIDTSAANFLVALITTGNNTTPTISDSKSNTWTRLNLNTNSNCCSTSHIAIYYVASATVGSGHTFTCGGASIAATCTFAAFAGMAASPLDVQDAGTGTSTTDTITPTQNGDVIFAGYVTNQTISQASNGFAFIGFGPNEGGSNYAGGLCYFIQPTAAPINTTIEVGSNPSSIAAFKHQ